VEALRSLQVGGRFGGYAIDDDPYFKSGAILVSMVDPFAITSTEGMTATWTSALSAHPYVALREAKEESGQPLCIGQLVSFDGYIADSPEIIYDRSDIVVSGAAVRVVSNPIPDRTVGSDLKDFVVKMHRIGGWASPRYQVILFGDGTVVFEDKGGSIDGGFRIATISEESVRQLRGKFVEADFFSMSDYDEYAMTDAAYTRVTLNMDGKRKSVLHYYGNTLPAEKITGLEKSIYQIIEPFKWVEGDY
jgi:hypothetical protein